MAIESGSSAHCEIVKGDVACATDQGDDAVEVVAAVDASGGLVEQDGELYWGLARHDDDYRLLFGDARQALALLPELGGVVASLFPETVLAVDVPSSLQQQLDSGELAFQVTRSGENLAHLVDRSGRMRHVLKLDTRRLTPEASQAWSNLRARAVQLETMRGLRDLEDEVAALRAGLQDDRLALVDSAWSLIEQARTVSDGKYRKDLLCQALDKAVEARDKLARSIDRDLSDLAKQREHGVVQRLVEEVATPLRSKRSLTEVNAERAEQVVRSVAVMESATRAVALVHMHHGEPDAARTVLGQFQDMLRQRQLDDDAVITAISSFAREDQKPILAQVLSSHARALEICGAEPVAVHMLPPDDVDVDASCEEGVTSAPVPTCSQCGRDIEAGATMCAYHRGKKQEANVKIMGGVVLGMGTLATYRPKALKVDPKILRFLRP
ncbi:hypothetical protein [Actinomyces timonensis]|uniref:hypothetical protein n=1 Tax=Actinomyces timonensis TaxID=1288391 RepID=UPI0012B5C914|nr:hypothetical protein [Actinomyces timonensis]